MTSLVRTLTINADDISPLELASVFAAWRGEKQAEFFSELWVITRSWPGAGWCQQSYDITKNLDAHGRSAIETLSAHVLGEEA
jgi:hypothetical protein